MPDLALAAPPLRDYQSDMVRSVRRAIARGHRRMYCALPTGCGKTRVASELVASSVEGGRRVLWLVHRRELVQQAADAISARLAGMDATVGIVMASQDDSGADVVVASVQSLRPERLDAVGTDIPRVIIDECHHVTPGSMYQQILDALDDPVVVGITATPYRADRLNMEDVLPYCAFDRDIPAMIQAGWLCDLRYKQVNIAGLDLTDVKMSRRLGEVDFSTKELAPHVERDDVVYDTIEKTIDEIGTRPTVVFAASVAHAKRLAELYGYGGVPSAAIYGDMLDTERRAILADWRRGALQLVTNCAVLTEGFDYPDISCVVMARPTLSVGLYTQMIGRGTRLAQGKDHCLVLDITGRMPARAVAVDLADIVGENLTFTGDDGEEQVIEVSRKEKEEGMRPHALRDPYGKSRFAWTHHPHFDGVWFTPCGEKTNAVLIPDPGGSGLYHAYLAEQRGRDWVFHVASYEMAPRRQAIADLEATLAKSGRVAATLGHASKKWRSDAATPQQLKMLGTLDGDLAKSAKEGNWSKGDVSLAIGAVYLRSGITGIINHLSEGKNKLHV